MKGGEGGSSEGEDSVRVKSSEEDGVGSKSMAGGSNASVGGQREEVCGRCSRYKFRSLNVN